MGQQQPSPQPAMSQYGMKRSNKTRNACKAQRIAHSNAGAKSKGRSARRLRTSSKFNWLPQQRPLGNHQMNIGIIIPIPHQDDHQTCKVGQGRSWIFWDILHDTPIFAILPQKVLLLTV